MNNLRSNTSSLLAGAGLLALAATSLAADYESTVVSQGPVGYWRLNESLQPQVVTGAANQGSLTGTQGRYIAYPTRGLPGPFAGSTAVGLDGVASSVSTDWSAEINPTNFTTEMWVKPNEVPKFAYVAASAKMASPRTGWYLAQDDGSTFNAGSAYVVRFFFNSGTTPSLQLTAPATNTSWNHLVLTYNGTTASLYLNGELMGSSNAVYIPAISGNWTVGSRSDNTFFWPGQVAEVAMYGSALTAAQVANHFNTASTAPATYANVVKADAPLVYYRFQEPIDPPAVNLGTKGTAARGLYIYNANAGVPGPVPPPYNGFEAANKAVRFDGTGDGAVNIPALRLNTNTVTMTAWVKPNGAQDAGDAIVISGGNGLTIDRVFGGYGIGYTWADAQGAYNWSPASDSGLPALEDNQWSFVALVVQPTNASVYIAGLAPSTFSSAANPFFSDHTAQAFDSSLIIGNDSRTANRKFNGSIDEVAIWNRSLTAGELYTQYASALGNVQPKIFTELADATTFAGDPLRLTIDAGGTPPLTYTWKRGTTTVGTSTNGQFTIASASATDAGTYTVTISNGNGNVTSAQVNVTVNPASAPQIIETLGFANRTLYPKATLNLGVIAGGGGLKYQWFKDSNPIAGATNASYIVPSITNTHAGVYTVSITNVLGNITAGPVTITVPAMGAYEAAMVASSPEAWYRLAETPGATNMWDAMGRHDGYYTNLLGTTPMLGLGSPGAIAGNTNTAATFTPANQSVGVVPYANDLISAQFTIEAWVKPTAAVGSSVPISFGESDSGSSGIWWQMGGGAWQGAGGGGVATLIPEHPTAQVTPGQWTHLVMTYNATDVRSGTRYPLKYYINGQSDPYVWTGSEPVTRGALVIGGRVVDENTVADWFFNGQVDEVAIYKRLLPTADITAHYQERFGTITAPYFSGAFTPQTVLEGSTVTFSTIVQGSAPIRLQWYKDGSMVTGATNGTIALTNVAGASSGDYVLWATNSAGVTSQTAQLTVVPTVLHANVTNGMVLHLRFDGNLNDSSGKNNNGTGVGSPDFNPGLIGPSALHYATVLQGTTISSTDYVTLGRPADLQFGANSSFTVGFWVKLPTNAVPGDLPFIGVATNSANNPGWGLSPSYQDGGWQWFLNDGVATQAATNNLAFSGPDNSINDGQWHHFVLTVDRNTKIARSFLDGVVTATQDITGFGSFDTGAPITIGQDPSGAYAEAGEATLDDLGVWNRALTPVEVIQIYSAGANAGRSFDTVGPAEVKMTVNRAANSLTINYSSGTLLQSDSLGVGANWTPVPGASAPSYTTTIGTGASKFYRVQLP